MNAASIFCLNTSVDSGERVDSLLEGPLRAETSYANGRPNEGGTIKLCKLLTSVGDIRERATPERQRKPRTKGAPMQSNTIRMILFQFKFDQFCGGDFLLEFARNLFKVC